MEVNYIPDDSGVVYNDLTGKFPFMSIDGSVCFFVLYHNKTNAILVKPIVNVDDRSIFAAYKEIFETLEAKGFKPKMNVMDNQATKYIKKFLTKKNVIYNLWSHTIIASMLCGTGNPNIYGCVHCSASNH